eukprot:TRINITY_DN14127_c0_g2_i3.p1 TRINITY_DN14127_c0_g2~~TRINITY_DN14127_c0_g2_i3.p1  ORF type:complete len:186 (-),score=20.79 TRINITY_DN14127_c0_g2_i3:60-617(-)
MIHARLVYRKRHGSSKMNFFSRLSFFNNFAYAIGGLKFSLNDIEHGVLRCNAKSLINPFSKEWFKVDDPRRRYVLERLEPRIHFALNCGAVSCPPISVYEASKLDKQLSLAARNFISQEVELKFLGKKIQVHANSILKWYGRDFGSDNNTMLQYLLPYFPKEVQEQFRGLYEGSDTRLDLSLIHI